MNSPKEYFIYCDESVEKGQYYSDFYGGVLVDSNHLDRIQIALENHKLSLHLKNEIKWNKVTANYLDKYISMIDLFFEYITANELKVRVMFRQNRYTAQNISSYNKDNGYFLLYYQFIKHAFGLKYSNIGNPYPIYLRLFFDEFPDSKKKSDLFKDHIHSLQTLLFFKEANLKIRRRDINEVDSKKHVLLQCLDIVLGAMAFRLNDMHKKKIEGTNRRGKTTIAKEKLYKHIRSRINAIYPNFNIGESTGKQGNIENSWNHPYRHWSFKPKDSKVDDTRTKKIKPALD